MASVFLAIEPMRIANRFAKRDVFRYQLLSEGDAVASASNGMTLQPYRSIQDTPTTENVFVCSSFNPKNHLNPNTIAWLKSQHRHGAIIGALDTGCYLLASAGLIHTRRVTLHWEAVPAFREDYPRLHVTDNLFEIDNKLITCAGGTTAIDLMLHIIEDALGRDIALQVCEQFVRRKGRQPSDVQRIDVAARFKVAHPRLLKALELMEQNVAYPLTPRELAEQSHLSVRHLERLFRRDLDTSPSKFYLKIRLERARLLLRESALSVSEIAVACGFSSSAHFARAYSSEYNLTPSSERRW